MFYSALNGEQLRHRIDMRHVFAGWEAARTDQQARFAGSMGWRGRKGTDYLYRRRGRIEKSLGPRSRETEMAFEAFTSGRQANDERATALQGRLEAMARVAVALGMGRMPATPARIIRRLGAAGLGPPRTCIVGTNALFAYEADAAVTIETGMLATGDMDIALDARRRLQLLGAASPKSLLAILREVDGTFALRHPGDYRAQNAAGYMVDLIEPAVRLGRKSVAARQMEFGTAEVWKLDWLVEAPRRSSVVLDERGLPLRVEVPDPRWFAAHKHWLSMRDDRDAGQRLRDAGQADLVASLSALYFDLPVDDRSVASLPQDLRAWLRSAYGRAQVSGPAPQW